MNVTFKLDSISTDRSRLREETISHRVFDALKRAIVQLQLQPGNLLSEAEVAKQLGVSRQPVREAFIKLAEVGLVEVRPQRGTFVMLISRREVETARFIREAIEVAVVRKAAGEASQQAINEINALVEEQRAASRASDVAGFLRLDESFHQALARSAGCDDAWRVLENLKVQMDRVRFLSMPFATPVETLVGQHQAIADAVATHSPEEAEKAMREHLSEILKSLPKIAAERPDLFVSETALPPKIPTI